MDTQAFYTSNTKQRHNLVPFPKDERRAPYVVPTAKGAKKWTGSPRKTKKDKTSETPEPRKRRKRKGDVEKEIRLQSTSLS